MDLSDQIAALNPQPGERFSLNWILPGQKMTSVVLEPHQIPAAADALPSNADIWIGMNPVGPQVTSGRGTSADVTRLTSLYADLDDKPGGCPAGVAEKVIDELCKLLGEDCTYMTFSGHGIHPVWVIEPEDASNADIDRLIRRWGRLVKHVAKQHGGQADSVFDLARILRAIGTLNNKESVPVEVAGIPGAGGPMTLDQVRERLDEAGIFEEEEEDASEVKEPVPQRGWAATECWYAAQTFAGWQTEIPKQGRHPWLTGQFTRLEAMKILGCLTASQYATGTRVLGERFAALCVGGVGGEKRPVGRYEIADCQDWGKKRAAGKSRAELLAEVGNHEHDMFGDIVKDRGSQGLSGGSTGPFGGGQPGPTIPGDTGGHDDDPTVEEMFTRIFEAEADFWTARRALKQIHDTALATVTSPWPVFANCVARALMLAPIGLVLPGLVGGNGGARGRRGGTLNWIAAAVDSSGGNKTTSAGVGEDLVYPLWGDGEIWSAPVGSGEGMVEQFWMQDPNDPSPKAPKVRREAVMFMADEVDDLLAQGDRKGNTTMTQIRHGFSGGTLGASYVVRGRTGTVQAHTYRMTLIVNAQPERCGPLFADYGGTPQRIMFFPAGDPRISEELADWDYQIPRLDLPDGMALLRKEMGMPPHIKQESTRFQVAKQRGQIDRLDGHMFFARMKLAAGLAILDCRTDINEEDWRLSGIATEVHRRTRDWTQAVLKHREEEDRRERGRLTGIQSAAADTSKTQAHAKGISTASAWIVKRLKEKGGSQTKREMDQALPKCHRDYRQAAYSNLLAEGRIRFDEDEKRWYLA